MYYLIFIIVVFDFIGIKAQDTLFNIGDIYNKNGFWKQSGTDASGDVWLDNIGHFQDNKLEGICTYYDKKGAILSIGHYHLDTLNGEHIVYRPGGSLHYIENLKMGKLNGIKKWYNFDSILTADVEYKDGLVNGATIRYYLSGNVKYSTTMYGSTEIGPGKQYRDTNPSTLEFEFIYVDGNRITMKIYSEKGEYLADIDLTEIKPLREKKKQIKDSDNR